MLRLTPLLREIFYPSVPAPRRALKAPVVIWNLVRRCNLCCEHCYSISADRDFPGELNTQEVMQVMGDLKRFGVPALILSGGEPLLRPDIYEVIEQAKALAFYVGLSTNGTLIDDARAARLTRTGVDYVGISIDGEENFHDRFRRQVGAHAAALRGVRLCRDAGLKVGLRFTLTQANADQFPYMLNLLCVERIDKFYLSHLNYGGRGNVNRRKDAHLQTTRRVMNQLLDACWRDIVSGVERDYVTGNNDADGVYLLQWVQARFPEHAAKVRAKLVQWGGNASGVNIGNIDNLGNVHPDTYWWNYHLGNVRERPFSEIWLDTRDPLMAGLKQNPRPVEGRCAACAHLSICGGNTRVRALQIHADPWAEDPGCYLDDHEIGLVEELSA